MNKQEIIEKYNKYEKENGMKLSTFEDFSCDKCSAKNTCNYAWDLYNKDGDCIAEK